MRIKTKNILLIAVLMFFSKFIVGAEKTELVVLAPNEQLQQLLTYKDAAQISQDYLRIAGVFNEKNFSIKDIKNISVEDANGKKYKLSISEPDIITEFGEIVSVWFSFDASRKYINDGGVFFLVWGDDVNAENERVPQIGARDEDKAYLMTFFWKKNAKEPEPANFATIEVIADSRADYFFLWYLLPMALIFTILAIRKINLKNNHGV